MLIDFWLILGWLEWSSIDFGVRFYSYLNVFLKIFNGFWVQKSAKMNAKSMPKKSNVKRSEHWDKINPKWYPNLSKIFKSENEGPNNYVKTCCNFGGHQPVKPKSFDPKSISPGGCWNVPFTSFIWHRFSASILSWLLAVFGFMFGGLCHKNDNVGTFSDARLY